MIPSVTGFNPMGVQVLRTNHQNQRKPPKKNEWVERGRVIWSDGSRYEGTLKHKVVETRLIKGLDGYLYSNYRVEAVAEGQGKFIMADGSKYEGGLKAGLTHGKGLMNWANGDKYLGNWDYGQINGDGKYVWANGTTYDGGWNHNRQEGFGVLSRRDGSGFAGEFKNGEKTRKGQVFYPDGMTDEEGE